LGGKASGEDRKGKAAALLNEVVSELGRMQRNGSHFCRIHHEEVDGVPEVIPARRELDSRQVGSRLERSRAKPKLLGRCLLESGEHVCAPLDADVLLDARPQMIGRNGRVPLHGLADEWSEIGARQVAAPDLFGLDPSARAAAAVPHERDQLNMAAPILGGLGGKDGLVLAIAGRVSQSL